jgi:hypothetical protein
MLAAVTPAHPDEPTSLIEFVFVIAVVASIEMEGGGIQVPHYHSTTESKLLSGSFGNRSVELGDPEVVEPVRSRRACPTPFPRRHR